MERVIAVLGCLITGLRIYCVSQKSQPVTSFHSPFPHELVFWWGLRVWWGQVIFWMGFSFEAVAHQNSDGSRYMLAQPWVWFLELYKWGMLVYTCCSSRGVRDRKIRDLRSSLVVCQVEGQSRISETIFQKQTKSQWDVSLVNSICHQAWLS